MQRSIGVTAAAVVLLLGSAILVMAALGAAFAVFFLAPRMALQGASFPRGAAACGSALELALAGWGITTAVGIFRLRPWARISLLAMSIIAIVGCLLSLVSILLLMPVLPGLHDPDTVVAMRVTMLVIFGLPGAIAAWWVMLFTRPRVKQQFAQAAGTSEPSADAPGALSRRPRRPVSITVIAIAFLAAVPSLACALYMGRLGSRPGFPVLILGASFAGRKATFYYLALIVIEAVLGLGLWWMRPWARLGAIAFCVFGALNTVAMVLRPDVFRQAAVSVSRSSQIPQPFQMPPAFLWFVVSFGTTLTLLALWFLVTRKAAFAPLSETYSP